MKTLTLSLLLLLVSCSTYHPLIIAHRGASVYLPEHTFPAVFLAHSWNIDFIEPDIILTKDNIPTVFHDIFLDTATNVAQLYPPGHRSDGIFSDFADRIHFN